MHPDEDLLTPSELRKALREKNELIAQKDQTIAQLIERINDLRTTLFAEVEANTQAMNLLRKHLFHG